MMSTFKTISVVIIAKNAADTIVKCLDSCVNFLEVIVVIDENSSDQTSKICSQYKNVTIYTSPFLGFGKMKQYAVSLAANDWVLSLDADEVLSPFLLNEIAGMLPEEDKVYAIHRHNFFKGRHIDACGWNKDYPKRLFNKKHTNFSDQEIHETIKLKGMQLVKLQGPLLHYAYQNEKQLEEKAERYALLYAKDKYRKKSASLWMAWYKSVFTFFKDYILRKGIFYGAEGYTISKYNAIGSLLKYKYLDRENKKLKQTLIISTYNRPDALAKVLSSVAMQSRQSDQVIVADDGSNADTSAVVKSFEGKIKNLLHVWHEDNGFRLAAIRNKAIQSATGDFLSLIDGDMVLHPDFLKTIYYLAKKNTYLQGKRVLLNEQMSNELIEGKRDRVHFFTAGIKNRFNTISQLFLSKIISKKYNSIKSVKGCSMHFWKEDAVKINGFNEAFIGWGREDSEFLCRLLNAGIKRKNIILGAVAYHLYHQEALRSQLAANDLVLHECIKYKKKWCKHGLYDEMKPIKN